MKLKEHKLHPAAEIFPAMTAEEFEQLKASIEANGQREPGMTYKGLLIDGRHRALACEQLGREVELYEMDEDQNPWAYVLDANLHRRHLTTSQRSMIAAKMANLKHGSNQHKEKSEDVQICTPSKQAADMLNVSKRSVMHAKSILDKGSTKLIEAVEKGDVAVGQAAQLVDVQPSKAEQSKIVAGGKPAIKQAIEEAKPKRRTRKRKPVEPEGDDFDYVDEFLQVFDIDDDRNTVLVRIGCHLTSEDVKVLSGVCKQEH